MPGSFGIGLRYFYYRSKFKKCGKNLIIGAGVYIDGANLISVGDNVHIDRYCIISTGKNFVGKVKYKFDTSNRIEQGEINIGDNIHIAQFCILMGYGGIKIESNCVLSSGTKIYSLTNTAYNPDNKKEVISLMPYSQAHFIAAPVLLGKNVWLGLNVIVMPDTSIGDNSFCSSNSLIMDNFDNNSYILGNPAKKIRNRFE